MEQQTAHISNMDHGKESKQKNHKKLLIVSSILVVAVIAAILMYINLYKIPYDKAVKDFDIALEKYNTEVIDFNNAVDMYNVEASALAEKNEELDKNIDTLSHVINAETVPVDELLLSEAQSVLREARSFPKDSVPAIPELSKEADEVIAEASEIPIWPKDVLAATCEISSLTDEVVATTFEISTLTDSVQTMGDYSEILNKVQVTESKYRSMIENFKSCDSEVLWLGVDKEYNVLRFVIKLSNSNDYPLRGVTTEWVAYDVDGAIVGSFDGTQPDIPANDHIFYVGGAGSANLSGTPVRIEAKNTTEGLLTNRVSPQIAVSNVKVIDNGFGWYSVSADCVTDSDINTVDLDGQIIIKDTNGQTIDADFWSAENLPDTIDAGNMFKVSVDFFDLPAIPEHAEVYLYYKWE